MDSAGDSPGCTSCQLQNSLLLRLEGLCEQSFLGIEPSQLVILVTPKFILWKINASKSSMSGRLWGWMAGGTPLSGSSNLKVNLLQIWLISRSSHKIIQICQISGTIMSKTYGLYVMWRRNTLLPPQKLQKIVIYWVHTSGPSKMTQEPAHQLGWFWFV